MNGDGYSLHLLDEETSEDPCIIGPGLIFVYMGDWTVGGRKLNVGQGFELTHATDVIGDGLLAVAELDERPTITDSGGIRECAVVRNDKNWGYELETVSQAQKVQLKLLHVLPGHRTSLQYHVHKDEVIIFFDGSQDSVHYAAGDVHRVTGPAWYFEASTFFPDDVIRIEDDYGRS